MTALYVLGYYYADSKDEAIRKAYQENKHVFPERCYEATKVYS